MVDADSILFRGVIKKKVLIIVSKIGRFKRVSGGGGADGCVHCSVVHGEGSDK